MKRTIREELGIDVAVKEGLASVRHGYTHFRITLHAFLATRESGRPKTRGCKDWRWVSVAELTNFAFSKADRKILQTICNS